MEDENILLYGKVVPGLCGQDLCGLVKMVGRYYWIRSTP